MSDFLSRMSDGTYKLPYYPAFEQLGADGLIAPLVECCTGVRQVMDSNPVQGFNFTAL